MKNLTKFLLILLLLAVSPRLAAQDDLSYLPPGLHKLTPAELRQTPLVLSKLPHYHEGKELSKKEILPLLMNTEYAYELYGDKNGKAKAVVIRKATEEERKAKEAVAYKNRMVAPDWENKEAPRILATTLDGVEVDMATLKGKVVVLNFWFIGCKPCIQEMPELNELRNEFKGEEVVFLALALDKADRLESFLTEKEFLYQIIPEARGTAREYKISGYPSHMVINQEGIVKYFQRGYRNGTGKILEKQIAQLLE